MDKRTIKRLLKLKRKKYRFLYKEFIIEGKRLVKTGYECKAITSKIYCTEKFFKKNTIWIQNNNIESSFIDIIPEKIFKKISHTKSPSGISAVCQIPNNNKMQSIRNKWVFLDKISDPGNLGTILRTASWFGIKNIALSQNCVDPYNPKTIRAGMGAHFYLRIFQNLEVIDFIDTHTLIAMNTTGDDISQFIFPKKYVLILGNEAHGISPKTNKTAKNDITIKKLGLGESLNVATAASIIMYLATIKK